MSNSHATVNCDTEFRVPPDCLREGDVACRVVKADCDIVDTFGDWVTFKVRLLLKIRIKSGELVCTFFKEIVLKESVWLDCNTLIKDCKVVAAVCKCVVSRGKVHCNLTVKVRFFLKKKWDPCGCHQDHCCCRKPEPWCRDDEIDWWPDDDCRAEPDWWPDGDDCCRVERHHRRRFDKDCRPKKRPVCAQPVIVRSFQC